MSLAVVGPMERQDFALAAARQQQEADGGGLKRPAVFIRGESCGQSTKLVVGQESLAPLAAVASDALAGVGALEPKAHGFRFPHDDGEHRHGPVGGGHCQTNWTGRVEPTIKRSQAAN